MKNALPALAAALALTACQPGKEQLKANCDAFLKEHGVQGRLDAVGELSCAAHADFNQLNAIGLQASTTNRQFIAEFTPDDEGQFEDAGLLDLVSKPRPSRDKLSASDYQGLYETVMPELLEQPQAYLPHVDALHFITETVHTNTVTEGRNTFSRRFATALGPRRNMDDDATYVMEERLYCTFPVPVVGGERGRAAMDVRVDYELDAESSFGQRDAAHVEIQMFVKAPQETLGLNQALKPFILNGKDTLRLNAHPEKACFCPMTLDSSATGAAIDLIDPNLVAATTMVDWLEDQPSAMELDQACREWRKVFADYQVQTNQWTPDDSKRFSGDFVMGGGMMSR